MSRTLLVLAEKTGIDHDHGYSYQKVVIWNPLMGNVYPWGYPLPWPPNRAASGLFEWWQENGHANQVPSGSLHHHERLLDSWTRTKTPFYNPDRETCQDIGEAYDNGIELLLYCWTDLYNRLACQLTEWLTHLITWLPNWLRPDRPTNLLTDF